jgi:hypothetical protein
MLRKNNRDEDIKQLGLVPESVPQDSAGVAKFFERACNDRSVAGAAGDATEIILIGYAGRGGVLEEDSWWGTYVKDGVLLLNHKDANGVTQTMQMAAPMLPAAEYEKAAKGEKTQSGTTFHVSFALPELKTLPSQTAFFTVRSAGAAMADTSIVINDFDLQAQKNLDDTRTATLARTAVRVVLRTIAAQKAKQQMNTGNPIANLLINVGADILTDQLESADTRGCFLIPKTVQIARLPVQPGVYTLDAAAHAANGAVIGTKTFENITVKQGEKKFVFYGSFK